MTSREPESNAAEPPRPPAQLGIRLLWAAIAASIVVLIVQIAVALGGSDEGRVAEPRGGEITVSDALALGPQRPVAVRGFVFFRKGFPPRLCSGTIPTDPPTCRGPFLDLIGLDESRLQLRRGKDGEVDIAWSDDDIAVLGTVEGAQITVDELLG